MAQASFTSNVAEFVAQQEKELIARLAKMYGFNADEAAERLIAKPKKQRKPKMTDEEREAKKVEAKRIRDQKKSDERFAKAIKYAAEKAARDAEKAAEKQRKKEEREALQLKKKEEKAQVKTY